MQAQRQEAVRVGSFTVLAFAEEQAQHHILKRLFMGGYQAQETAHFVLCRKSETDRIFLLHRLGQDFQEILRVAHHQPDALHPQLLGSTQLQLSRAQSALTPVEESQVLQLADEAAHMIGCNSLGDPYKRIMQTGTLSGLHVGSYHLIKAGIFNALRHPEQALREMDQFKRLTRQTYHQDETRYQAWSAIVMAEALMGLLEYQEATQKLMQALVICSHINSIQNVSMITDLFHRLLASPYGSTREVKTLGDMLSEWYQEEQGARNGG